jgi:hypothetical protein
VLTELMQAFDATPVGRFSDPGVTVPGLLSAMCDDESRGVRTTASESVVCSETGVWLDGWTVIVEGPGGVTGLFVPDLVEGRKPWADADRAARVGRVERALRYPLVPTVQDAAAFAGVCVDQIAEHVPEGWTTRGADRVLGSGPNGGLSKYAYAWALHALLTHYNQDHQLLWAMQVLRGSTPEGVSRAHALVAVLDQVAVNWRSATDVDRALDHLSREARVDWSAASSTTLAAAAATLLRQSRLPLRPSRGPGPQSRTRRSRCAPDRAAPAGTSSPVVCCSSAKRGCS